MEYIYGYNLPIDFINDDLDLELWYPITEGDHSSIYQIGNGISLHQLLSQLKEGDSLVSDEDLIETIYDLFHNLFVERPAYWSGNSKIEFIAS